MVVKVSDTDSFLQRQKTLIPQIRLAEVKTAIKIKQEEVMLSLPLLARHTPHPFI